MKRAKSIPVVLAVALAGCGGGDFDVVLGPTITVGPEVNQQLALSMEVELRGDAYWDPRDGVEVRCPGGSRGRLELPNTGRLPEGGIAQGKYTVTGLLPAAGIPVGVQVDLSASAQFDYLPGGLRVGTAWAVPKNYRVKR